MEEDLWKRVISPEDVQKFERIYNEQIKRGKVTNKAQFDFGWCLIHSQYSADIKKGIGLLEDLFKIADGEVKRDCIYYLAVGNAKIKEYDLALNYIKAILHVEPTNSQAQGLERAIKQRMKKDGILGIAIVGGAVLALGGLAGLGLALLKK